MTRSSTLDQTVSPGAPGAESGDTIDAGSSVTENYINSSLGFNPPAIASSVWRSRRSRAFSTEWWKGPSPFIAYVADKNLTFNLATEGENSARWTVVVQMEFDMLLKNGPWTLVPRSSPTNILTNCWIFHRKQLTDSSGTQLGKFEGGIVTTRFWKLVFVAKSGSCPLKKFLFYLSVKFTF